MPDNERVCAVYCRCALADDAAIEQQRERLQAYARQLGYTDIAVYEDNGYSAHDTARPGFAALNAAIAAGKVGAVVMRDYSRIARETARCREWLGRIDKRGVVVLCHEAAEREQAAPLKHHKKKQRRHTVRTPPPTKAR